MAPGYRANNQSRRANRSYVDHDVFEGLPVRNWRRETVAVAPPQIQEVSITKDKWDVELPWGMPKDSHLLPQHSQDLLRAARSGRLYLRRSAAEEEEVDPEAAVGEKPEKKEEDTKEKGFAVKTWKLVPRHLEGPEIEYLAKRRKGLTGVVPKIAAATGPTMTNASVRRTDAAGNFYVVDLVVAEGQTVEGELISQTVIANSTVSGMAPDGVVVQPAPPRRRPPPPKRKAKGPGRGKKRKLPLPPRSVPGEPGAIKTETETGGLGAKEGIIGPDGVKVENSTPSNNENDNEDIEMGDDSVAPSDEDDEDGSDDEEGDGQDDQEDGDVQPEAAELEPKEMDADDSVEHTNKSEDIQELERDVFSSSDFPLATKPSTVVHEQGSAGSPLKNVMSYPPSYEVHSPNMNSDGEAEAEGDLDEGDQGNNHGHMHGELQDSEAHNDYDMQHGVEMQSHEPISYGHHDSTSGIDEHSHMMEQTGEYSNNEEMLLDGDVSGMSFDHMAEEHYAEQFQDDDEEVMSIPVPEHMPSFELPPEEQGFLPLEHHSDLSHQPHLDLHPDPLSSGLGSHHGGEGEEDIFEDLLGSLEDHLNDQEPDLGEPVLEEVSEVAPVQETAKDEAAAPPHPDSAPVSAPAPAPVVAQAAPAQEAETHGVVDPEPHRTEPEPMPEPKPEPEAAGEVVTKEDEGR